MELDSDVEDLLIIDELLSDDEGLLTKELKRGATQDNLDDWFDGTGRWDRKGVPHEKRCWNKKAHRTPSATFRSWFRCRWESFERRDLTTGVP
ncbi:unnamed protein product [Ectocarpus sp. CCAP 1310/34]|nr:unnamed protein product [Ectocarpus sp. CCAP 1310/34]